MSDNDILDREIETMNGFTIIADRMRGNNERVIFGVRMIQGEREYVTAITEPAENRPRTWYWGHYIRSFAEATLDFINR